MKVKCIDNRDRDLELTFGKIYNYDHESGFELDKKDECYYMINDNGHRYGYHKDRFITIKEERKLKLEKINENKI
jgi:hypothetical protein